VEVYWISCHLCRWSRVYGFGFYLYFQLWEGNRKFVHDIDKSHEHVAKTLSVCLGTVKFERKIWQYHNAAVPWYHKPPRSFLSSFTIL